MAASSIMPKAVVGDAEEEEIETKAVTNSQLWGDLG